MAAAILVGASGLVGSACLRTLLDRDVVTSITALVRKPLAVSHPKLDVRVVDFDRLADSAGRLTADAIYLCLGTTIRVAGSQERFREVDHGYTLAAASLARQHGTRRLALVSSIGASARSSNFYLRVKGETERDVASLGYESVDIFRPSFLIGARDGVRPLEAMAVAVARALSWATPRVYRPIEARRVGEAMVAAVALGGTGVRVHTYESMRELA